jgi:hypothetical protein
MEIASAGRTRLSAILRYGFDVMLRSILGSDLTPYRIAAFSESWIGSLTGSLTSVLSPTSDTMDVLNCRPSFHWC